MYGDVSRNYFMDVQERMMDVPGFSYHQHALLRTESGSSAAGRVEGFQPPIYTDDYSDQLDNVGADGCVPVPDGPGLGVT
jgi:hypothetical protein